MGTGLYGGTRGDGPELHFGFGKPEGNLHSQSGTIRQRIRYEYLKTKHKLDI
jgi:hypothetical protein